ncbi:MAG: SGNH/GDSL hydrolase family protein [Lachnospiraceae bacterium]|nr:SGNH/GDSL hydrolase family protein [Lachnospiraceae bacterium]
MVKSIVCFGDSNTHGYNSKTGGRFTRQERWPGILSTLLGAGYDVHEEGLSGRTTCFEDPLFEGLNGYSYLMPCLLSHEPVDKLIIMLGTNDSKIRFGASPENIARGMERLVQKAIHTPEAWRNGADILIIAPPPIESEYLTTSVAGEMGPDCDRKTRALSPLYQAVAQQNKCGFLDAGSIPGMGMYPYDYMHLSPESHQLLAKTLADIIRNQ